MGAFFISRLYNSICLLLRRTLVRRWFYSTYTRPASSYFRPFKYRIGVIPIPQLNKLKGIELAIAE